MLDKQMLKEIKYFIIVNADLFIPTFMDIDYFDNETVARERFIEIVETIRKEEKRND